jgi:hypothetical protein
MKNLITLCIFGILFYSNSNSANAQSYSLETGMAPFSFLDTYTQIDSGNVIFIRRQPLSFTFPNSLIPADSITISANAFEFELGEDQYWRFFPALHLFGPTQAMIPTDSSVLRMNTDIVSSSKSITLEFQNFTIESDSPLVINQAITIFESGDVLVHFGPIKGSKNVLDTLSMGIGNIVADTEKGEILDYNILTGTATNLRIVNSPEDLNNGLKGMPAEGDFFRFVYNNKPTNLIPIKIKDLIVDNGSELIFGEKWASSNIEVQIFDVSGSKIWQEQLNQKYQFNYSKVIPNKGVFLIQLSNGENLSVTKKVVVLK